MRRGSKRTAILLIGAAALVLAASAWAAAGDLTQKAGTAGCISETGTAGACTDGVALDGARGVATSPDGANVYVASGASGSVSVFDRDENTGALTQKASTAGCVSDSGSGGACTTGVGLAGASSVTVSPDGATAYVTALSSDNVVILDRNPTTGALTRKAGEAGCISELGFAGVCANGTALAGANSLTISPDGANAYLAAQTSNAIVVFDRNTSTGVLTQKAGTAGCISEDGTGGSCVNGKALTGAFSVTVSADGTTAYVASPGSDAVAVFDRNTSTGALTQKAGTAGCISETGTAGACVNGTALDGASSVTTAPDGTSAYVSSTISGAVSVFDRNTTTGVLTQKPSTAGCISDSGTAGECVNGTALVTANSVAIAPDGTAVYVASQGSNAVAVFIRDTSTGALTQKPGVAGCTSEDGTAGACSNGTALNTASAVTVAPDGENAYVASFASDAVAVFDRGLPPQTAIDSGPTGPVGTSTPTFGFSSDVGGVTFQCRIDAAPFGFCSGPGQTHTPSPLADGPHTFEVRAIDSGGTQDATPASRSFSTDDTAPETTIDSGPTGLTTDAAATFTFSADDGGATFECRFDESAFGPCSGPGQAHSVSGLSDGPHSFEVRASDPLGNVDPSPATRALTTDTAAPVTRITRPPNRKLTTKKKTAKVVVSFDSEPGATFECQLDEAAFKPCTSPFSVKAKAKRGKGAKHSISIRATDSLGHVEPNPPSVDFKVVRKR